MGSSKGGEREGWHLKQSAVMFHLHTLVHSHAVKIKEKKKAGENIAANLINQQTKLDRNTKTHAEMC